MEVGNTCSEVHGPTYSTLSALRPSSRTWRPCPGPSRRRLQREVTRVVMHDQKGRLMVGDVIVPTHADGDWLVEVVATVERLSQVQQVRFVLSLKPSCSRTVLGPPSPPTR